MGYFLPDRFFVTKKINEMHLMADLTIDTLGP